MNDISIVTAFFDIGRGSWTPENGLPHYLERTTKTYFERFAHMASLKNDTVVFTSEDLYDRTHNLLKHKKSNIIVLDFPNDFYGEIQRIRSIQTNPSFKAQINPAQVLNPEYWSPEYVLVNKMKSYFVNYAIQHELIDNELVAWMDFGYCREESTLGGITNWQYPFDKNKIHFFNIKEYTNTDLKIIIANNDVHITGPCIVGSTTTWPKLEKLVDESFNELIDQGLIDDDQTLLLMSYLKQPELFKLHKVSPDDWFVAFRNYNENKN
jgi:protein YibB